MQLMRVEADYSANYASYNTEVLLRATTEEVNLLFDLLKARKEVSLVEKQPVENLAQKLRKSQYEKFCTKALKLIEAQVESFSSTFAVYDKLLQQYVDVFFTSRGFRVSQVRDHEAKVSW
jgi:hypothetical protein